MRIGVLGTGNVGTAVAARLGELGHDVRSGSRSTGDLADAAAHGEIVVNATAGTGSLEALRAAGAESLAGKVVLDLANPIVRGDDGVILDPAVTDSLAEQLQRAFPDARIVKTLNTVNAAVMVRPERIPGDHVVFVCGDDDEAKRSVTAVLGELGWPAERVVDLGPIAAARAAEAYLLLWLRLTSHVGHTRFNIAILAE